VYYSNQRLKTYTRKTKLLLSSLTLAFSGIAIAVPLITVAINNTCTLTGFYQNGIEMSAQYYNPTTPVTGVVNAGCNTGVFFGPGSTGTVNGATISGNQDYGIIVEGANVTVENSSITNTGIAPIDNPNSVAIFYANLTGGTAPPVFTTTTNGVCTTTTTTGTITNNSISGYGGNAIEATCPGTTTTITNNIIQGQGAQSAYPTNGVDVNDGASATITGNVVSDNSYNGTQQAVGTGIEVQGGAGWNEAYTTTIKITNNIIIGNDVGIWLSNVSSCSGTCVASTTPTNITVENNTIENGELNNIAGDNDISLPTVGYQAGVADQGDADTIANNTISGAGYNSADSSPTIVILSIDTSLTNNVVLTAPSSNPTTPPTTPPNYHGFPYFNHGRFNFRGRGN